MTGFLVKVNSLILRFRFLTTENFKKYSRVLVQFHTCKICFLFYLITSMCVAISIYYKRDFVSNRVIVNIYDFYLVSFFLFNYNIYNMLFSIFNKIIWTFLYQLYDIQINVYNRILQKPFMLFKLITIITEIPIYLIYRNFQTMLILTSNNTN